MPPPPYNHPIAGLLRVTREWLAWFRIVDSSIVPGFPGITQLTGPVTTPAGGGVQPTTITPTGVIPGTYGDALNVGQFTVNAAGQLTAALNVPISGAGTVGPTSPHYEPLTNGDPVNPDLIYNGGGDVVMAWVVI